ncbi:MAG: class I SAM-dependent methyltransferase [Actinomycetota bacterium]|nr:class I SAM-dependent methyltransferase [Actinomycetota bacterium]
MHGGMDAQLAEAAKAAVGFMPEREGLALYEAGVRGGRIGPLLEIGSYCGKSAIYLGAAARVTSTVLFSIDHHRGSEEHQPGEEFFDPRFVDPATGDIDTLGFFRRTISAAGLEDVVIGIVGRSADVAKWWGTSLGMVFIDGGHSPETADADYEGWAPHVVGEGLLVIHDVFPDPAKGGRPPFDIYVRALESDAFREVEAEGSLRVLQRVGDGF